MTSKLTFYQCEITPEKNCVVDDITSYLNSLTSNVVDNFQYIKLDLDLYIKINSSQTNVANFNYNYVAVKNSDVSKVYYYFIIGIIFVIPSFIIFFYKFIIIIKRTMRYFIIIKKLCYNLL